MMSTLLVIALSSFARAATTITQEFVVEDSPSPTAAVETVTALVTGVNTASPVGLPNTEAATGDATPNVTQTLVTIQTSPNQGDGGVGDGLLHTRTDLLTGVGTGAGNHTRTDIIGDGTRTDTVVTDTVTDTVNGNHTRTDIIGGGDRTTETDTMPGTETDTRLPPGATGAGNATDGTATGTARPNGTNATATGAGNFVYGADAMVGAVAAGAIALLL